MSSKEDIKTVRNLAHKHLGHHQFANGVYPSDETLNDSLVENSSALPEILSMGAVKALFAENGIKSSDAYLSKFRGEAILYCMGASMEAHKNKTAFEMPTIGFIAKRLQAKFIR